MALRLSEGLGVTALPQCVDLIFLELLVCAVAVPKLHGVTRSPLNQCSCHLKTRCFRWQMQPSYRLALGKREKLGRGTFVLGSRLKFTNGTELQELGYKCFILIQRVSQALNISGIRDEIESKNNSGRESGLSLAACGYAFSDRKSVV